jgi:N-acyl-D-aspartate/D-glutamate deacylase
MEAAGVSLNVAPLVGHAALRMAVGLADNRAPTEDELRSMRRLAAESIEQGAFGLSTGLTLAPSMYASTDEIVSLAEAVSPYEDAFYATHARVWAGWHVRAIEEAVTIGRRAGLPVQFSHIAIIDPRFHGAGPEMVGVIERALDEGVDVTCDAYPYAAAGTPLSQLLPSWLQEGGVGAMLGRLRDPVARGRAREDMRGGYFGGIPWNWDRLVVSYVDSDRNRGVIGLTIEEIAESRSSGPIETFLALVEEEDNHVGVVAHNRVESDVRFFMTHPQVMIGSDGRAISPRGLWSKDKPHPRFYGTYPRILGRYVRDEGVLSLEQAVHKMTAFPARRLGLRDRGRIAEGLVADIVIFNPETIIDRATFEEPHQLAEGVAHLFVAGAPVIVDGKHTGARPGRVLRRGQ